MKFKKFVSTILIFILLFLLTAPPVSAEQKTKYLEARITNVTDNQLELIITNKELQTKKIIIKKDTLPQNKITYQAGDKVIIENVKTPEGEDFFMIVDFVRSQYLLLLFIIFLITTIIVAKWRGFTSLLGMGVSFFIIFKVVLPPILAGNNPVQIAILSSLLIIPTTFYLSHGFNRKTTAAMISTIISLFFTGALASSFVKLTKLTGLVSEELVYLNIDPASLNTVGILLAGIIISLLGILDDVTLSQASVVKQIKETNPKFSYKKIYEKAMQVGRDHISSMVNTLILVYAGSKLPLLLLFIETSKSFSEVINYEIIAQEIVGTLVSSIGLILAVPITTIIGSLIIEK